MPFLILIILTFTCAGQTTRPAAIEAGANLPAQPIGPNDLVSVSVYDAPELTRTVRVGADGSLRLPMLKNRIPAAGNMPVDLEKAIAEALRAEGIIVDPYVTVTIAEYNSHPIQVAGAVKKPVSFQAMGRVTLLEALARAEGLREDAGSEILISMPPGPQRRISVRDLIEVGDPAVNVTLTGGEEIRVPEAGRIFIVGNVKKPGAFTLKSGAQCSILEALAFSEGLMPYATNEAFIYRREANGSKNEIHIALSDILKRKSPDVLLLPNDILYVPDNKGRRLTLGAIERIITFGASAGSIAIGYGVVR